MKAPHIYIYSHTHIYIYIMQFEDNSNLVKLSLWIYLSEEYHYTLHLIWWLHTFNLRLKNNKYGLQYADWISIYLSIYLSIVCIVYGQQFLVKHRIVQVQHPVALALCDLFLFPKQKIHFKCNRLENIKRNKMVLLHSISKEEIQRCFSQWKIHWNKYVECRGESFHSLFISVLL